MNPGEVTTVIMQFNLPTLPTAAMRNAVSPRTGGKEYCGTAISWNTKNTT